jgi:pimeloyl-ACP methyl ester carboxylesterase
MPGFIDGHGGRRIVVASLALGLLSPAHAFAATFRHGSVLMNATHDIAEQGYLSLLNQPIQYVEVNGATLGYREAGHGRPLVLISGSSSTMAEWDPRLLDILTKRHRVIIFDNRGVGTSSGSVHNLTIELMAQDTAQLIDEVAGGKADVLGWSMGGYVAQVLAIAHPDHVGRLVLASTDCGGPDTLPPTPRALRIITDPNASQADRLSILFPRNRIGAGVAWSAAIGAAYAAVNYQPANAFSVNPAAEAAQAHAAGPLWLGRGRGTCEQLARIKQHTLIAAGIDDVVVPVANHQVLLSGIRRAEAHVYQNAGHAFLFQPGLHFGDAVNAFLVAA